MLLATLKTLGLVLMTGPSLFVLIWSVTGHDKHLLDELKRKSTGLVITGSGMYLIPLFIEGAINFQNSGSGIELVNLLICPLFIVIFNKPDLLHGKLSLLAGLILGLAIITFHASLSHSGYSAGVYPFLGLIVHLVSVSIWSGGLAVLLYLHFTKTFRDDSRIGQHFMQLKFRFFQLSVFLLILMIVTGSILMVNNVHNTSVMGFTSYGGYLSIKLYLSGALIFIALLDIIRVKKIFVKPIVDTLEPGQIAIKKFPLSNTIRIVLILSIIIYSAILSRLEPPNIAPFINPQSWQMSIADQDVSIDMQPVAGSTTDIRFEIFFSEQFMQMRPLIINFDLYIPDSEIGIYGGEAIQVSQTSYQGETTLPAPGSWHLDLSINMSDGTVYPGAHVFELPSQPLVEDIHTYLSFSSITYNKSNLVTFLVGLGLILTYTWLTRRSFTKEITSSLALTGILGLAMGIYMVMSVVLVKTYPSTYWKNPQSYSSTTINQGKVKYLEHCGECHGETGGGDGPWAIENRGRIPDLASPHMDVHTDGEIYWWIARGIPGMDMPPLGNEITKTDNWNIIYFLRSLRHGVP